MRTFSIILLSMLIGLGALANEKNTSILVRQITEEQRNELPDKTMELKLQCYSLTDKPLAVEIKKLIDDVVKEDLSHTVYMLRIAPSADNAALQVSLSSLNDIKNVIADKKKTWGIMAIGSYCYLLSGEVNKEVFAKAKGKHTLIQEFEFVEDPVINLPTTGEARWQEGQFLITTLITEGFDRLTPAATPSDEPLPNQQE